MTATTPGPDPHVQAVWDRYGALTRFVESSSIALERERRLWESIDLVGPATIQIRSSNPFAATDYRVRVDQHLAALGDAETLAGLVLLGTCSLAEELARISLGVERLPDGGVEVWGEMAVASNGRSLANVKPGGKGRLVLTYAVRNAIAHGLPEWTAQMAQRVSRAGCASPQVGSPVEVARDLESHRTTLRSFMRLTGQTTDRGSARS